MGSDWILSWLVKNHPPIRTPCMFTISINKDVKMKKINACLLMFTLLLSVSLPARSTSCPTKVFEGHVGSIHYSNSEYYPTFNIQEYSGNWLRLSYDYGLNTNYGKAMYALLLMAKSGNYKVQLVCTDDGRINEMTLLDDKWN